MRCLFTVYNPIPVMAFTLLNNNERLIHILVAINATSSSDYHIIRNQCIQFQQESLIQITKASLPYVSAAYHLYILPVSVRAASTDYESMPVQPSIFRRERVSAKGVRLQSYNRYALRII